MLPEVSKSVINTFCLNSYSKWIKKKICLCVLILYRIIVSCGITFKKMSAVVIKSGLVFKLKGSSVSIKNLAPNHLKY